MNKAAVIVFGSLVSGLVWGDTYYTNPTSFVMSGGDRWGKPAYELSATLSNKDEEATLVELSLEIYSVELEIEELPDYPIVDPDFSDMVVTNYAWDTSQFSFTIPFGGTFVCEETEKIAHRKRIYIWTNFSPEPNARLSISQADPCAEPVYRNRELQAIPVNPVDSNDS